VVPVELQIGPGLKTLPLGLREDMHPVRTGVVLLVLARATGGYQGMKNPVLEIEPVLHLEWNEFSCGIEYQSIHLFS
jgi:hypothetical protein